MKIFLLFLFWSLWYVVFSTRTILAPLLPVIEDELGITHALAGGLFLFASIGYTLALFLSGVLSPRIGYKLSIAFGCILLMISLLFLKYASSYSDFVVASLFLGLGGGIYLPGAIPLITSTFGRGNWGKAIAFHDTAASFSILSIPILAALALRVFHWRTLFVLLSSACFLVLIIFWAFAPNPRPQKEKRARLARVIGRRDFWIIATAWIFAASNSLGLYNVIPLFLVKENGIPLETANTIFGISRVGGLFLALVIGFLVDRYGFRKVLFLVMLTTGLSTTGLALVRVTPLIMGMLLLQATFSVGFFPAALVAISQITSFSERSIFTGATVSVGVILGLGLTPFVLGAVADVWNFQIGILVLGILTTLSCGLLKWI
jgi:MFS family permease